ncbi:MAG TPA: hypothetical protein VJL87_06955 [Bdellovibrionota bacterium]|nr:hypothetical protein [Bdellovibrionota bacterium]
MAKPMMLQKEDDEKIENLKRKIGAKSKVAVVRIALSLLEQKTERAARISRWKKAAKMVAKSSAEVLEEFQPHSRIKRSE